MPHPINPEQVAILAGMQCTYEEIAAVMGIKKRQFIDRVNADPELRLMIEQGWASGKASIRLRVREWADHVLFMGYDMDVNKDGKAKGSGTKTIYTSELPHFMAKSRTCQSAIPVGDDGKAVWAEIIK